MTAHRGTRYGLAALTGELRRLDLAASSGAHDQLFRSAAAIGGLIGGGELEEVHATAKLIAKGLAIGRMRSEVERTVAAGVRRGLETPRVPRREGTMLRTRTDAVEQILEWWQGLQGKPWRGARAATLLRILTGVARVALRAGKVRLTISTRQISEAAGVSVSTVEARRPDWERHVRRISTGSPFTTAAAMYQLDPPAHHRNKSETPLPAIADCSDPVRGEVSLVNPAHNYWHKAAGQWWLYCLLLAADSTVTAGELAAATGISVGSVRRTLARFRDDGVAVRDDDDGWELRPDRDPDRLDRESEDFRGQRVRRHQAERMVHRRFLQQSSKNRPNSAEETVPILRADDQGASREAG